MKLQLLGTADVRQVPVYGCDCRACRRARREPAAVRRPCSALLAVAGERYLIDGGLSDLCERFPPGTLQGILLTHYHMDHVQGLFHLRWGKAEPLPVYGPDDPDGCADLYKHPGMLSFQPPLEPFQPLQLGAVELVPLPLAHSKPTFGYLFRAAGSSAAYLTDTKGLPPETERFLQQQSPDLLVIDCSSPPGVANRNHNNLDEVLAIRRAVNPHRLVLTHLSHKMDLWLLDNPLPAGVVAGHDGMCLEL
ncbi:phosphonate metabolism protein PhnP [Marinobacterium arenosum]|uniref:phosphonate metabolism protein PhnP n=1 Tax=Marinobacterium arenosum TaxID=2862496 RepID=UPI001C95B20D|nr:phosphonate metabolism protein PhnP [Marinobacterium arenosum]MBY4677499.1 phosphonate metabolism protein PhnP [Marinobacterium arenosum]